MSSMYEKTFFYLKKKIQNLDNRIKKPTSSITQLNKG